MPIMTPTMGLLRTSESEKREDKFRPPKIRKEVLRKVKEQTKRYKDSRIPTVFKRPLEKRLM